MKIIFINFFVLLSFIFPASSKQETNERINNAINTGNSKELARFFNDKIELKVVDKENYFSKKQAEAIMEEFFRQFPPDQFLEIKNQQKKIVNEFVIGRYKSGNTRFKVSYLLKKVEKEFLISQFRIEKPHEN